MSICRVSKRSDPFARVDKRVLADNRLSWKAKGILAYLLGHPNDWEIRVTDIVKRSRDGRDAVYSAMKELRSTGYAVFETIRNKGKIVAKVWNIRDTPDTGFPDQEAPIEEKPEPNKNKGKVRMTSRAVRQRVDFGDLGLNGNGQLKLSKSVKEFARFSTSRKWHLRRPGSGKRRPIYSKGGQEGGWSRRTLEDWQETYKVLREKEGKEKVAMLVHWYVSNYDKLDYMPIAQTFNTFFEKFEAIVRRRKQEMKRNGADDNEKANARGYWINDKFIPTCEE